MARRTLTNRHRPPLRGDLHLRPADWARSYQKPFFKAMLLEGRQRAMLRWHRKAGKDLVCLLWLLLQMASRPGYYVHVFPKLKQARETIWDGILTHGQFKGMKYLDLFPPEIVRSRNEAEMLIELHPFNGARAGSVYQLLGVDNLSTHRGPNVVGAVLSEVQDMKPSTWPEVFEPMILSNKGAVVFPFTPRGQNHAWTLWNFAQGERGWFTDTRTVEDTRQDGPGEDGSPVVSPEQIDAIRRRGDVPEELIQQEYYCSFQGQLVGSIYGDCVRQAENEGRVTRVPWDSTLPVGVMMDLGLDTYAVIFYQRLGREVRLIDCYAVRRQDDAHIVHLLKERKPYTYGRLILPHDARAESARPGLTAEQYYQQMKFRGIVVADKLPLDVGHKAVRRLFPRLAFDATACSAPQAEGLPSLLDALLNHHFRWDEDKRDYSGPPVHDTYSHFCDALRTGVVGDLDAPMVDEDDVLARPRYMHGMDDALATLSGRRRQLPSAWG